ncbi:MAG: tetratricopeptide repeat protein, partial [Blastocatellia bacterium]
MKIGRSIALTTIVASIALAIIAPKRTIETAIAASSADERATAIESALYARAEFFGAQAIVPFPTAEARTRLAEVARKYPNDAAIALKLAELDERLGNEQQADRQMLRYVEIEKNSLPALGKLAEYHHRRARFAGEAAVREQMIAAAPREERAPILEELIGLARRHRLEKYQRPDFFRQLIASDPASFEVVKKYVEHLIERNENAAVLAAIRQYKNTFSGERDYFLEKEIATLTALDRKKEAEAVYRAAFDPFWSEDQSNRFYQFLSGNDRLLAYGRELKERFRRNPDGFDTAVRLFHYLHNDYEYNNASAAGIFARLETARATRGAKWTPAELTTISQLLIDKGDLNPASRFLYSLHNQGGLKPRSDDRARVLYSLFALLANAGEQRTPFTAGDLRFYQDVAQSDPHPGMLGGVLSLVLADSNPRRELAKEEEIAVAHFNRAAAWRLFTTYKQEYPTSPQMARMYLDLIRLYSGAGETTVAAGLLAEFEKRYADAPQFAEVALRLADCYVTSGRYDEERAIYQRILDYAGKRKKKDQPLVPSLAAGAEELTSQAPTPINFPVVDDADFSIRPRARVAMEPNKNEPFDFTYVAALNRYVASLARENRTADILALYAAEIKKHPGEEGLYEQWLQWLGQTNLVEEQLRVYQEALKRFPTGEWNDRLARWYLRRDRKQEFERYSRELVERMNDAEVESYLLKFVNAGDAAPAREFDANLYRSLHQTAHRRFPHNLKFVESLLRYYAIHKQWDDWRQLLAEYYFESKPIREQYLQHLASTGKLRESAAAARAYDSPAYKLFRADCAVWLSNHEEAVDAYRDLNRLYPNTPEFAERLVAFTRSFGQKDFKSLEESARVQLEMADASPASESYRTAAGELRAELGDYKRAGQQWDQLLRLGAGDKEIYLNTATVFWDYFQYDDALRVLRAMRRQMRDDSLYAFQIAAILESKLPKEEAKEEAKERAKEGAKEAIAEYAKDLNENSENYGRARRRLATLWKRKDYPAVVRAAFNRELGRAADRESVAMGCVELLHEVGREDEAAAMLRREVARSRKQWFLNRARNHFRSREDHAGEVATLRRLTAHAKNARLAISYQLQLAEHAAAKGRKDEAAAMIGQLVHRFPTNYGVLAEAGDFYWRLGKRDQAISLLAAASERSRGRFHYIFARKLASRQVERGQLGPAEQTLIRLYKEDPRNADVFEQLARVYVRTSRPDALRERYRETIRAIKESDLDRAEINHQVGRLREQVIESFTQLKDYGSAIEQHIEIINRDPDDEEAVASAIKYARRYGGADKLIEYYTRTSEQAYKDYRWNLVLARVYDAKSDWASAARELRKAITNQPEMIELHAELSRVYTSAKDYEAAIKTLNHILKLTNDDPPWLKSLAEVHEKAGRKPEAGAVRARLPVERPKIKTTLELFAEARNARQTERARAVETYRKAFDEFASEVYKHELRDHELSGYVEAVRDQEPLDQILRRLWELRARIRRDTLARDNLLAGKARTLLATFDRAVPEAVGRVAAEYATGNELAAMDRDLREWMSEAKDGDDTIAMLFNLSQRAGLHKLSEEILIARKEAGFAIAENPSLYHTHLTSLVNFYSERGAYGAVVELLGREQARDRHRDKFNYRSLIAEYARLVADRDGELRALREEYNSRTGNLVTDQNAMIERYFEALLEAGEAGRAELRQCVERPHPYRFQLISFLLRRNEVALAREAVDRAPLSPAWKSSRQAELSLVARDPGREREEHFLRALGWQTIGEMVASKPDVTQRLIGDSWFYLASSYGKWLALSEKSKQGSKSASAAFLSAGVENRPKDAGAQQRLGVWHLEQGEYENAIERFDLALEMQPGDKAVIAALGSAHFKAGHSLEAREQWAKLVAEKEPKVEDCSLYLRTLHEHGLAAEARAKLKPFAVKWLNRGEPADSLKPLLHKLARSFNKKGDKTGDKTGDERLSPQDETEKTAFLRQLCEAAPRDASLPEMIVRERLVGRAALAPFYEMLVSRTGGVSRDSHDYDFAAQLREHSAWSADEVEEALDHTAREEAKRPESQRSVWQREYLDYLLARRDDAESSRLIVAVELELKTLFPRPDWLRLARLRLDVRGGRVAQAMAGLKRFARIETSPRLTRITPPNLARLTEAA